jgi:TetR/AcrR family transcriptional regulator of autoinduction and epiphytic fitness
LEESFSQKKRKSIVQAAAELFLENGYGNVSMDAIAALAKVSKRTVYNHFPSKELLFSEIVKDIWIDFGVPPHEYREGADMKRDLSDYSAKCLVMLRSDRFTKLLRLVLGESGRFPELKTVYSENGIRSLLDSVGDYLKASGKPIDDIPLAAQQYLGMVKEALFWPVMLGILPMPSPERDRYVIDDCTARFMKIYNLS